MPRREDEGNWSAFSPGLPHRAAGAAPDTGEGRWGEETGALRRVTRQPCGGRRTGARGRRAPGKRPPHRRLEGDTDGVLRGRAPGRGGWHHPELEPCWDRVRLNHASAARHHRTRFRARAQDRGGRTGTSARGRGAGRYAERGRPLPSRSATEAACVFAAVRALPRHQPVNIKGHAWGSFCRRCRRKLRQPSWRWSWPAVVLTALTVALVAAATLASAISATRVWRLAHAVVGAVGGGDGRLTAATATSEPAGADWQPVEG